jgi:hypothetical protein
MAGVFLSLDAAPSTAGFERICPTGAMQGCIAFFAGAGTPLRKTPIKPEERRFNAAWGGFFFGYFLLAENCFYIFSIRNIHVACHAKESIAAAGPRTGVKSGFTKTKQYFVIFKIAWKFKFLRLR